MNVSDKCIQIYIECNVIIEDHQAAQRGEDHQDA